MEAPYATVDDLKLRWPDMPPGSEPTAQVHLEDASQFIRDVVPSASAASEATLRRVVCSVVRRAMVSDVGVAETQVATGPFSASYQVSNPHGDYYLTKQELKALGGGGRPKAFGVQIVPDQGGIRRHRPWCALWFAAEYCSCGADLTGGDPLWEP